MQIREFREDEFIDREKEIEFLKSWVKNIPKEILWLYGPKSTGKTTLIEYVIEKELTANLKLFDNYWIKYVNFRRTMVGSYDSFIDSFFEEAEDQDDFESEVSTGFNIGVFRLEAKTLEKIKNKKKNLFNELIEKLKKINKTKILVIDEIQTLEDIYYNGEKELLKELLNFCVSLTKEIHLAHVIILSSNTIFIDRIYNDAKLKITSKFKNIDHLPKEDVFDYLEYKTKKNSLIKKDDFELIWNYCGGCLPLIQRLSRDVVEFGNVREYLENEVLLAKNEIIDLTNRRLDDKEYELFKNIILKIITHNGYILPDRVDVNVITIVDFLAQKEIFFYDPLTRKVTGNNRLYEKAFERLLR